jgi:hypothetical protein
LLSFEVMLMEAYETLGEMLRALHEAFPGTEGDWTSTIVLMPVAKRGWVKDQFRFDFCLANFGEKEFKATLEIRIRDSDGWLEEFKEAEVEKPTPAEAIAEALARWKGFCDPTAAEVPAAVEAEAPAEADPWTIPPELDVSTWADRKLSGGESAEISDELDKINAS